MRHIGHRKVSEETLIKVFTILGYDIYIPSGYNNPTAFLKKGCPLWVQYDENGNCDIYECDNEFTLYPTLVGIIKKMYATRSGFHCKPLTQGDMKEMGLDYHPYCDLSAVSFDENDRTKAIVIIENDIEQTEIKGFKCAKISQIINEDTNALNALYEFIFNEYNINRYRGLLISFEANNETDVNNATIMNMVLKDDGKYYYQFE